jgi:predicted N-acetyltransferase YhbS
LQITDLRECPEFFDIVADRVWRAWWRPNGHPLEKVSTGLREMMKGERIPFALVARDGAQFLGSTLGIECDLAERPQYAPWVAAVWVEPQHRLKTVGRSLVGRAVQNCFERGFPRVYLCSSPERWNFYTRQGWTPIEHGVGDGNQTVYVQERSA